MRPSFNPRLINDPFGDPGLFIPFVFERRALLFDLGDLAPLSARDLLKVTHVFVTHAHMDHFLGFDTLLRIFLGREKTLHLFGPPDFFERVEGRLSGYTWNLVDESYGDLSLKVTEVHQEKTQTKLYKCRDRFVPEEGPAETPFSGMLLKRPSFHVLATLLDHRIPCLGLSLVENFHVNIIKEALESLSLPVGPWINRFKKALYENRDLESDFMVTWEEKGRIIKEERFVLGELADRITRISQGQKITYITDILGSPENHEKVAILARNADHLFIEAAFLECDREKALKKYHLTARQAGEMAKSAGAKQVTLFHFSPRYEHRSKDVLREAEEAFHKTETVNEAPKTP